MDPAMTCFRKIRTRRVRFSSICNLQAEETDQRVYSLACMCGAWSAERRVVCGIRSQVRRYMFVRGSLHHPQWPAHARILRCGKEAIEKLWPCCSSRLHFDLVPKLLHNCLLHQVIGPAAEHVNVVSFLWWRCGGWQGARSSSSHYCRRRYGLFLCFEGMSSPRSAAQVGRGTRYPVHDESLGSSSHAKESNDSHAQHVVL